MKKEIFAFMADNYAVFNPLWKLYFPLRNGVVHHPLRHGGADVFDDIYKSNRWGSSESVSGQGSTLAYTVPIRRALPKLFRKYNVRSFFDAPCGDFNWMSHVEMPGVDYVGGDLVADMVTKLQSRFGSTGRRFVQCDVTTGPIPPADLWMCRDLLFHLRNEDIKRVLKVAAASEVEYILTTTYAYLDTNIDLEWTGGFRTINLERSPFNLPKPVVRLDDFVPPAIPRYLALWRREQIAAAVQRF